MSTEITLDVGGLTVTYATNHHGIDHGSLFQKHNRKPVKSDQIDYDSGSLKGENLASAEMAFVRPLKDVIPRLELLGFNLGRVRHEYESSAKSWREERKAFSENDSEPLPNLMSFEEFYQFVTEHALDSLDDTFVSPWDAKSEGAMRGRFANQAVVGRIPHYWPYDIQAYSERSYFGELVSFLDPYSVMRLLGEGKANGDASVVWQYGPLVDDGWATEREFVPRARRAETFLIATEGSSDVHILQHALQLLRPGTADFFRFIDMTEGHPFPGTGNLVKFAKGLVTIDVQNKVVFLFDNDAEGLEAQTQLSQSRLPANMRTVMLPDLDAFRNFPTEGPEGAGKADINGRAAAIECYLDLGHDPSTRVRWSSYKESLERYQGALVGKKCHVKKFLKQTSETITAGSYDVTKIEVVLDRLVAECTTIAVGQWGPDGNAGDIHET